MKSRILTVVYIVAIALLIITFSIGLPIYVRPFYYAHIAPLDLVEDTGKTVEQLKADYVTRNAKMVKEVEAKYTEAYYDAMKAYYDSVYPGYMDSLYPSYKAFKETIVRENTAPVVDAVPEEVWELYAKHGGNIHLDGAWRYSGGHTVFGQVYQGMDVVDAIASVKTGSNDKPETDVIINSIDVFTYEG